MKTLLAIAIPILPGKTPQWKKFTNELKTTRLTEFIESRKKLNVQERTFFQSTPQGDTVIVTLEGENPREAFMRFGQSTDAFTKWFVSQVKEVHGIDLTNPPTGALPELVVDSNAKATILQN